MGYCRNYRFPCRERAYRSAGIGCLLLFLMISSTTCACIGMFPALKAPAQAPGGDSGAQTPRCTKTYIPTLVGNLAIISGGIGLVFSDTRSEYLGSAVMAGLGVILVVSDLLTPCYLEGTEEFQPTKDTGELTPPSPVFPVF